MLDPSYPIRKFQDLLDRLNHNDGRYFQCFASLARDFQIFAPQFAEVLDLSLQRIQEPPKNLYFLYVLDCVSKTLPRVYAPLFTNRLYRMFIHAYRHSDAESAFQLMRLLEAWEGLNPLLFPVNLLASIREGVESINQVLMSPNSPEIQAFDIGAAAEMVKQAPSMPPEIAMQAIEDSYPLLFERLVSLEKNKVEFENITTKAGQVPNFSYEDGIKVYVNELYQDLPKQCLNCGCRFSRDAEIAEHLDWHFARFKKDRDRVAFSPWLPTREVWVDPQRARLGGLLESGNSDPSIPAEQSAICDPEQLDCPLCGEPFDLVPDEQNWRCKDAVIVYLQDKKKNVLLHTSCHQSLSAPDPAEIRVNT